MLTSWACTLAKRKVKTPKQLMHERADELARTKCMEREAYCQMEGLEPLYETCGGPSSWCHIVEKVQPYIMRWDQMNCLKMCRNHHAFYTFRHARWMLQVEKYFPENWAYIREHINDVFDGDYESLIKELESNV